MCNACTEASVKHACVISQIHFQPITASAARIKIIGSTCCRRVTHDRVFAIQFEQRRIEFQRTLQERHAYAHLIAVVACRSEIGNRALAIQLAHFRRCKTLAGVGKNIRLLAHAVSAAEFRAEMAEVARLAGSTVCGTRRQLVHKVVVDLVVTPAHDHPHLIQRGQLPLCEQRGIGDICFIVARAGRIAGIRRIAGIHQCRRIAAHIQIVALVGIGADVVIHAADQA